MNQEYKNLAKNSVLFAIANLGSKLLKFIIVPFYTYYLSTTQYGTVDTITTTISLLSPFILLGINEAALRFSMKEACDPDSVFVNCFFVLAMTSVLGLLLSTVITRFSIFDGYWWIFYLILIATSFETLLMYYARGVGRNGVFAFSGIVSTVVLLSSNILFLVCLKSGEMGYLFSVFLSSLSSIFFISLKLKIFRFFRINALNKTLILSMLRYSLPLMPNAIMWWIMNSSDRYAVLWVLGVSSAGIYAISYKIPSIMSTFVGIFHQAWQLSAIRQSKADNKNTFFTSVFNAFSSSSFIVASIMLLFIKPMMLIFDNSYIDSWKYAPFLLLGAVFSGMSGFVGVNYTVSEKTLGAFITSAVGAVINIILNIILTPLIGMQGTSIATFVSFYILWLVRTLQTYRYVEFRPNFVLIHANLFFILIETMVVLFNGSIAIIFFCIAIHFWLNRSFIVSTIKSVVPLVKK